MSKLNDKDYLLQEAADEFRIAQEVAITVMFSWHKKTPQASLDERFYVGTRFEETYMGSVNLLQGVLSRLESGIPIFDLIWGEEIPDLSYFGYTLETDKES